MFNASVYAERRKKLQLAVGKGLILLLGNDESSINFKDNWYHFRQDSSFLYFFGIDQPGLAAIIDIDNDKTTVYGNDLTMDDIVWTGPQPTIATLANKCAVENTAALSQIQTVLHGAKTKGQTIHFLPAYRPENKIKLRNWLSASDEEVELGVSVSLIKSIVSQRSYKSDLEIQEIDKAANITAEMHITAMKTALPGKKEMEVVGAIQEKAIALGGQLSFPAIVTKDGQILHNHYHGNLLKEGDLLLVDCGAETDLHYAGDMTRTFPVSSNFSTRQKELYQIVIDAHEKAIAALKPGIKFKDIHLLACKTIVDGLKAVGLMRGDTEEAVDAGAHTMFFQCGLGHMMGIDVHDMEDLGEKYVGYTEDLKKSTAFGLKSLRLGKTLESRFVITVEPGIYIIPELIDQWKASNKHEAFIDYGTLDTFRDFGGIRVEEDFVITDTGAQLLGKPVPKTIDAIEKIRHEINESI